MHLALLFAVAACITAPCDPTDQRLQAEKNAALLAAYTEVVGPRFQLKVIATRILVPSSW